MTPGYKTTEFWLTAVVSLISLAGTLGFLTPDQVSAASESITKIISGVVVLVGLVSYVLQRKAIKVAGLRAGVLE